MKKILIFIITAVSIFAFSKKVTLSDNEKNALLYMYEEEKLAKDVYSELGRMYPQMEIFSRISGAEVRHEQSVENVLKHYNIPLPQRGDRVGKFTNPHIQKLYDQLMSKGKKSVKDALEVGIMVEVTDIEDLDKYLNQANAPDVKALFEFLRDGSYNHYNAFNFILKSTTGKTACELMDKRWCRDYPFQRGVGRKYMDWYWFSRR